MARYLGDQNKVTFFHESGTYAVPSGTTGIWAGQVTEHSITDAENKLINRFLGTADRSYDSIELGPRDVEGTLTYHPQDMRLMFMAIGSTTDTSGTASQHNCTEINTNVRQSAFTSGTLNPPISFTIEDSKQAAGTGQNFIRTINGCVPSSTTLTATQGEKINIELNYNGQTLVFSSGTTTTVTEETNTPYLWSNTTLTVSGMSIATAKEVSLEVNQNLEAPHYLNGSRDIGTPFPKNREYTLNITMDLDAAGDQAKTLYNGLYKTNAKFNSVLDLNADVSTSSQHAIFTMSGCRITSMENPSVIEGATESTIEIRPENVSAVSYDSTAATALYNAW
jgi:hypothetical protein